MNKFDRFKDVIFNSSSKKTRLTQLLKHYGYETDGFEDAHKKLFTAVSERHLQLILAPFLRALAIERLRNANTPHCINFRNGFPRSDEPELSMEAFLRRQARDKTWAMADEGVALAEALGVNLVMSYCASTKSGAHLPLEDWQPHYCYEANPQTDDGVHLYFMPDEHYFAYHNGYAKTIGNGNCLYNAFAQHIQQFVMFDNQHSDTHEASDNELHQIFLMQQKMFHKIKGELPEPLSFDKLQALNKLLMSKPEIKQMCLEDIKANTDDETVPEDDKLKTVMEGILHQINLICRDILTTTNGLYSLAIGAVAGILVGLTSILTSALSVTAGISAGLFVGACALVGTFFAFKYIQGPPLDNNTDEPSSVPDFL